VEVHDEWIEVVGPKNVAEEESAKSVTKQMTREGGKSRDAHPSLPAGDGCASRR